MIGSIVLCVSHLPVTVLFSQRFTNDKNPARSQSGDKLPATILQTCVIVVCFKDRSAC